MGKKLYIKNVCCWAPGMETSQDWHDWAAGNRKIASEKAAPALTFTEANFRRRLSQLSKMTVQVVHDVFEESGADRNSVKLAFVSMRGEIDRQLKINKSLIEENEILPAGFSLSVFNAPVALATIAEKLKGGYDAIYPSRGNFRQGFISAVSSVLCGAEKELVFVYGDELVPECYNGFAPEENIPLSYAFIVTAEAGNNVIMMDIDDISESPVGFLKQIVRTSLKNRL